MQRRFVTLMELLIVITLIFLMAGVISINIRQLMKEQRFETEVNLVLDELRLAQDLLLMVHQDTHVLFSRDKQGQGLNFSIKLDKNFPDEWGKEILRSRDSLTAIKKITFQNNTVTAANSTVIDLYFLSQGSHMSRGNLILSSAESAHDESALQRTICLPGYPSLLYSLSDEEALCPHLPSDEDLNKLTFAMQREINEKSHKNNPVP